MFEEVEDIVIEFEGNFDLDSVKDKQLEIIGIDTDDPLLKIESKFYRLKIDDSIGSKILLKPDADGKLHCHSSSDKKVSARRVMMKSIEPGLAQPESSTIVD